MPELIGDDLDFVKICLAFDPRKRPSAKDLLNHKYLSIDNHPILKQYNSALKDQSENGEISEESK